MKIESQEFDVSQKDSVEKFKLHISEKGTQFNEKINIDEKKDAEYFKVPSHNGLSESDNMYDFKMNITVSRVKKDRVCYITPLPPDLPRPNVLSKGLKTLSRKPPTHQIEKTIQQWRVGNRVDKSTLRQEVRDFCGQFPIYRLEPFTADTVSVAGRTRRDIRDFPLCDNLIPACNPNRWIFSCKIRTSRCVYYVKCKLDIQGKLVSCSTLTKHLYTSIVCCSPRCSK